MKKWLARWERSFKRRSRSDLARRIGGAALLVLLAVFAWGLYRVVSYAYAAPALQVRGVAVRGLTRLSEGEVLARSGFLGGMSILELDLDGMREAVEGLRWVRYANVQRVWPREIVISVIEREPIALARLDGQIHQVDEEGVILPFDALTLADGPVLDGLRFDDMEGNQARVRIYQRTLGLIGSDRLSEVHISEAGEVSVVPEDYPIRIDLGLDHHEERWALYLEHRAEIRELHPGAAGVDLRFEGQVIIRPGNGEPASNLTWQEEARLL
jgi:cell division protein FtsQ